MLILSFLTLLLHLSCIVRATQFFITRGDARDSDRTVAAFLLATCIMFILARAVSYYINPISSTASNSTIALWNAYGFMNGMFYLGLLHRMIDSRSGRKHRARCAHPA